MSTITWTPAPARYDYSGTLYNILLAEHDGAQLVLSHDLNSHHSSIAAEIDGTWYDSQSTQDWPQLDQLLGRDEWQKLVRDHESEALEELADWEDEED